MRRSRRLNPQLHDEAPAQQQQDALEPTQPKQQQKKRTRTEKQQQEQQGGGPSVFEGALPVPEPTPQCKRRQTTGKPRSALPSRGLEEELWAKGYQRVGGLDEAGRGPLAGPVVAAICVLPRDPPAELLQGLNDSKLLSEEQRDDLYARITTMQGVCWAAHVVDSTTIDRVNILQAALQAMREAALQLPSGSFDYLLVDGNKVPEGLPTPAEAVVKGDSRSSCIAAASIIAKVTRDRIMLKLDEEYPAYAFRKHKGYGVPEHTDAIRRNGPCAVHRRSFQPIRGMTGWTRDKQLAAEAEAANAATAATSKGADAPAAAVATANLLQPEAC